VSAAANGQDAERWAAAAAWSQSSELTPVQTVLWRAEQHPTQSSTSTWVVELEATPDVERLRAAHDWATRLVPRLRQRVVEPVLPTTAPVWAADPEFRLEHHLRRAWVRSRDEALTMARDQAVRPLDRARPLWEALLIEGLEDGGALWVLTIHHVLADQLGTVQLLDLLQSRTAEHVPDKPTSPPSAVLPEADPVDLAARGLVHEAVQLPVRTAALARHGVHAALRPRASTLAALRYAASLRRLLGGTPAPSSALLAGREGRDLRFLELSCPLADLREAARRAGGSLEDVVVAAVLGGLRRYHEAYGEAPEELPIGVRVSLDRADDPGNRHAAAMIAGPLAIEDPDERVAAVRGEVLSLHTERALDAFTALAPVANRLPSAVGGGLLASGAAADAFVLSLPGPAQLRYMAGAPVRSLWCFGPLPGTAITATLVAYAETACLGVTVDAAAVADPELLHRCLAEGLADHH
jgi:diacylglycerol O-acyltransferase